MRGRPASSIGDSGTLDIGSGSSASGSGVSIAISVGSGTNIGGAFSVSIYHICTIVLLTVIF